MEKVITFVHRKTLVLLAIIGILGLVPLPADFATPGARMWDSCRG